MSSIMPGIPADTSASPSKRRVDSSDSLKTRVARQELAIATSSVTPVKLQRPVPMSERRDKEISPKRHAETTTTSPSPSPSPSSASGSRKRTNTSQALSPTLQKRRSADSTSSFVMFDGELSVVEQIEHSQSPIVRRSLGKIPCRIARQSRHCVLELGVSSSSPQLVLREMTLSYDHRVPTHSFTLRGTTREDNSQVKSFSFTAATSKERSLWVQELRDLTADSSSAAHAASSSSSPPSSSASTVAAGSSVHARRQAREEMTGLAVNRPQRPVKRGGLVYTIPPKMTHIILVRHGHYVNAHAKNVSDVDQVLSQMGRQQAELTGKYLETLYHRCPARNQQVALFHSDLSRAVETAAEISTKIESTTISPVASSLLREGWPGQPFATDQMPAHMLRRSGEDEDKELDRQDLERMDEAYNTFFAENGDDQECLFRVIVCHANLIRYLLCRALRVDPHGVWGHFEINHCGVTRIDICRNRPLKVMAINETGHLPHSLITSSEDHL